MPGEPRKTDQSRHIDRRTFLGRSSAITIGGVAALSMAPAPGPRPATASSSESTARGLLLDMIRIEGEPEPAIEAYLQTQAQPLIGGAATSGNVYHLREQQVPASPLGTDIYFAAYQLAHDDAFDIDSVALPGRHAPWHRMALVHYAKIADCGRPNPAADAPDSIMIVLSHPTDVGYDALYNEWYTDNHMIDVARSPHFRGATRYRPIAQAGLPLAYLCIYEIEQPYSPELHEGAMHWLRETPDDFRQAMPTTPAGEGVLTLDIWGYCQRIWSGTAD